MEFDWYWDILGMDLAVFGDVVGKLVEWTGSLMMSALILCLICGGTACFLAFSSRCPFFLEPGYLAHSFLNYGGLVINVSDVAIFLDLAMTSGDKTPHRMGLVDFYLIHWNYHTSSRIFSSQSHNTGCL
jgi:hypothetical protein